jgi:hypothetical protein
MHDDDLEEIPQRPWRELSEEERFFLRLVHGIAGLWMGATFHVKVVIAYELLAREIAHMDPKEQNKAVKNEVFCNFQKMVRDRATVIMGRRSANRQLDALVGSFRNRRKEPSP